MKVGIIGDIHSHYDQYYHILQENITDHDITIQVGDMNIEPDCVKPYIDLDGYFSENNNFFIRGNHDDPSTCDHLKSFLGHFGYLKKFDIYYIGGAWSIDWHKRVMGVDYWYDEELEDQDFDRIIQEVKSLKPKYIISHDCPLKAYDLVLDKPESHIISSRTSKRLDELFASYKPEQWFFGHHHMSKEATVEGTYFRCIDINEFYTLEIA